MSDIDISSLVPCAVFGATTTSRAVAAYGNNFFLSLFGPDDFIETQALTEAGRGRLVGGDAIHDQTHVRRKWVAPITPVAGRWGTLATRTAVIHDTPIRPHLAIAEARAGRRRGGLFGGQAADGNGLSGEDLTAGGRGTKATTLAIVLHQL